MKRGGHREDIPEANGSVTALMSHQIAQELCYIKTAPRYTYVSLRVISYACLPVCFSVLSYRVRHGGTSRIRFTRFVIMYAIHDGLAIKRRVTRNNRTRRPALGQWEHRKLPGLATDANGLLNPLIVSSHFKPTRHRIALKQDDRFVCLLEAAHSMDEGGLWDIPRTFVRPFTRDPRY